MSLQIVGIHVSGAVKFQIETASDFTLWLANSQAIAMIYHR